MLAEYVVKLIFWPESARQAQMITNILFGKWDVMEVIKWLSKKDINALQQETIWNRFTWSIRLWNRQILNFLVEIWLASSNWDAKKLIQWWWIYCNEERITDINLLITESYVINGVILFRKGKKGYRVVIVD
jgi:tyrosyl-tRNA synthetase